MLGWLDNDALRITSTGFDATPSCLLQFEMCKLPIIVHNTIFDYTPGFVRLLVLLVEGLMLPDIRKSGSNQDKSTLFRFGQTRVGYVQFSVSNFNWLKGRPLTWLSERRTGRRDAFTIQTEYLLLPCWPTGCHLRTITIHKAWARVCLCRLHLKCPVSRLQCHNKEFLSRIRPPPPHCGD